MKTKHQQEPEVIEPEVMPPDPERKSNRSRGQTDWVKKKITVIGIGFFLDALDFLTSGLIGIRFGFIAGFIAAFFLFSLMKIDLKRRILYSLGAGIYCWIPGTEVIPLGTILGALFELKRKN